MMIDLPWPKPESHYGDDGPPEAMQFEVEGARMSIQPTNIIAPTTLRTRFRVECLSCTETLHRATTGPRHYIMHHLEEAHGWERPKR